MAGTAEAGPGRSLTESGSVAAAAPTPGQRSTSGGAALSPVQAASGGGPAAAANPARTGAAAPESAASPTPAGDPSQPSVGPEAPGAGSSCAPDCAPIVVASVGTYSGIVGQNIGGGVKALQAWVSSVNAKGGINGHLVQLFVADDVGDPARHRALVQQMVEERRAIAFLFNAEVLSGQGSVEYIDRVRVPVIGSEGGGEWFHSNQYYFPQHSSGKDLPLTPLGSATVSQFPEGKKKLGTIVCADGIQVCEDAKKTFPERAPKYGFDYVYNGSASLAQPDLTANCLAAQDAGAELLMILMDKNSIQRARSILLQHRLQAHLPAQPDDRERRAGHRPAARGGRRQRCRRPVVRHHEPGRGRVPGGDGHLRPGRGHQRRSHAGWDLGQVLREGGGQIGTRPPRSRCWPGLWSMKDETLGGLVPPRTFTQDQPSPHTCATGPGSRTRSS